LLLFFVTIVFSATFGDEARSLYKKIPFSSSSQTVNLLHQFENIYIQSVIANDTDGIKSSLKGIIRCKKLLNQDTKNFEKEYAQYNKYQSTKKQSKISTKKISKPKEKITPFESVKITKTTKKTNKPKVIKVSQKEKALDNQNILKNISINNGDIILTFQKALHYKDVVFFELNFNKKYKDIYDVKAVLPKNFKKNIHIKELQRVALSQNNKEKIRLVLENRKKIPSRAYIKDNKLIIHYADKKIVKKTNKVKPKQIHHKIKLATKNEKKYIKRYSKSIVIDPGHGGHDSGAVGYNRLQEKKAVLAIALKLRDELKKRGYRVYMTRSSDRFIDLRDRTHFANMKKADLFISIHANAVKENKFSVKGIETFYLSPARSERAKRAAAKENKSSLINMDTISKNTLLNFLNRYKINQSRKLAIDIQGNILKNLRTRYKDVVDGAVRPAPFWVLVGAGMPAVLVETGYITNPGEAMRLFNPFYQKTLAKGIANGIESYFYKN